jgi:hypothetical protein
VDDCVVKEEHNLFTAVSLVLPNAPQSLVYKVLKQPTIKCALNDLSRYHVVGTDAGYYGKGELLL